MKSLICIEMRELAIIFLEKCVLKLTMRRVLNQFYELSLLLVTAADSKNGQVFTASLENHISFACFYKEHKTNIKHNTPCFV